MYNGDSDLLSAGSRVGVSRPVKLKPRMGICAGQRSLAPEAENWRTGQRGHNAGGVRCGASAGSGSCVVVRRLTGTKFLSL